MAEPIVYIDSSEIREGKLEELKRTSMGISRRSRGLSVLTVSRSRLELILTSHRGIVQGPSEWVGHEPSTSRWRALSCGEPVRVRDFTAPAPNRL